MDQLYYTRTRTRDRSPLFDDDNSSDFYSSRRLVRTNSKRAHADLYDDDEYDDYPYTSTHKSKSKPSRALTIRQPTQLEKYNIWSRPSSSSPPKHTHASTTQKYYRAEDDDDEDDRTVRYRYTTTRYAPTRSDDEDDREREFRLKVKASFGRPKSSRGEERRVSAWSGDMFRRKEKWVDEDWETRERAARGRRDSLFEEEPVKEKTVRFHRVKRTRTEEWKPLSGFRR